jgi:glycosyltransferase involved in cell wall biosynthesis
MQKRILLGCYEIPGYGGASTATYKLFESMQNDGLDVCLLNIIAKEDEDYFRSVFGNSFGNPKSLNQVYNCTLKDSLFSPHPELDQIIHELSPDINVGIDFIAALLMKRAAPSEDLIYLTAGCDQVKRYIMNGTKRDLLRLTKLIEQKKITLTHFSIYENEAVEISDFIITHSEIMKFLFKFFYPSHVEKICSDVVWFAEWIYKDAFEHHRLKQSFSDRDIDIIFISSAWTRTEKNYELVKEIVSKLNDRNIHIIGEVERPLENAVHHGLITEREELFKLLGDSKTIVCPSLLDAAPGILFEASAMGCNVVASKNCGNWMLCNEELLVHSYKLSNFLEKISLSLTRSFDDNIDYFFKTNSYKNLVNTILDF